MDAASHAAGPRSRRRHRVPASGYVTSVLAVLAALVTVLLFVPGNPQPREPAAAPPVVGETEVVRITTPDGESVEELALIDTGASSSSIDEEIAEDDLGLDLDEAPTVEVSSALGEEERPLVDVVFQVAGNTFPAQVNVSDRSDRDEKILLGREQLAGYRVALGQSQLTSPDQAARALTAEEPLLQAPALAPTTLGVTLALWALLTVLLRLWVGLSTVGAAGCASMLVAGVLLAPGIRYFAEVAPGHFALACLLWTGVAAASYNRPSRGAARTH